MWWEAMRIDREKERAFQYIVDAEYEAEVPRIMREEGSFPASDCILFVKPCAVPDVYLSFKMISEHVAELL